MNDKQFNKLFYLAVGVIVFFGIGFITLVTMMFFELRQNQDIRDIQRDTQDSLQQINAQLQSMNTGIDLKSFSNVFADWTGEVEVIDEAAHRGDDDTFNLNLGD